MGKAGWVHNPVCWWLGLYFRFVCCLDEVSWTGCYWWLGDAGSCIQVVSFVWVLTIWYSLGYSSGEGNGTPLQYSCLENPMDGGAWQAAVHGVAKSEWLHFHFPLSCIGEEVATHSSILAWRIPWTEEPGRLQSMESQRVGHDWATNTPTNTTCFKKDLDVTNKIGLITLILKKPYSDLMFIS